METTIESCFKKKNDIEGYVAKWQGEGTPALPK